MLCRSFCVLKEGLNSNFHSSDTTHLICSIAVQHEHHLRGRAARLPDDARDYGASDDDDEQEYARSQHGQHDIDGDVYVEMKSPPPPPPLAPAAVASSSSSTAAHFQQQQRSAGAPTAGGGSSFVTFDTNGVINPLFLQQQQQHHHQSQHGTATAGVASTPATSLPICAPAQAAASGRDAGTAARRASVAGTNGSSGSNGSSSSSTSPTQAAGALPSLSSAK